MAKENQGKPTVSIIGAGRMGGALALALAAGGYSVAALIARRLSHAQQVAKLLARAEHFGQRTVALAERQLARLPPTELLIIATPDDAIASVARKLASIQTRLKPEQQTAVRSKGSRRQAERIVLHTSGALSSDVLSPLAEAGFKTGSIHPLTSISNAASGVASLRGAFFCLEGDRAALRVGRRIVSDLGGHAFSIEPRSKALYHAAAVMASGNITALFDLALEMLAGCGLSRRRARAVLLPLIQSAVANLAVLEPAEALTGTFARGDVATVQRHLAALRAQSSPEALAAYILLGQRSLSLAKQKKLTAATAERIAALLKQSNAAPKRSNKGSHK